MDRWSERASGRLRDGERIERSLPVGENGVVVTSHRVLAFTPEGDGANYRAIERPNVEDAALQTIGNTGWLEYVLKGGLAGVAGVGIGYTMDFGNFFSMDSITGSGASQVGMGGMLQVLAQINRLLDMLDDALLVGGLLGFVIALGALGMFVESRTRYLVIEVAGEEAVQVPAAGDVGDAPAQLRDALRADDAGGTAAPTEDPVPAGSE